MLMRVNTVMAKVLIPNPRTPSLWEERVSKGEENAKSARFLGGNNDIFDFAKGHGHGNGNENGDGNGNGKSA